MVLKAALIFCLWSLERLATTSTIACSSVPGRIIHVRVKIKSMLGAPWGYLLDAYKVSGARLNWSNVHTSWHINLVWYKAYFYFQFNNLNLQIRWKSIFLTKTLHCFTKNFCISHSIKVGSWSDCSLNSLSHRSRLRTRGIKSKSVIMVIISQYIPMPNHHVAYLKLIQCYIPIISQ